MPRTKILMWIEKGEVKKDLSYPKPRDGVAMLGGNPNSFCQFHRKYEHNMEECKVLANEIETLIIRGKLNRFIKRQPEPKGDSQGRPEVKRQKLKGVIYMIYGRPYYEPPRKKTKTSARIRRNNTGKNHEMNLALAEGGKYVPHNDAMVITTFIEGWEIKRSLVDCRSSCNAITSHVFAKMGIDRSLVEYTFVDVIGVTGNSVKIKV